MTFPEFQAMRKRVTAAEMKRAGVAPNEQTQYGWLYPGNLLIESTVGWNDEWMGMFYLLVEGQEYFRDYLERLARILYDWGVDAGNIEGERQCALCRSIIPKGAAVVRADGAVFCSEKCRDEAREGA